VIRPGPGAILGLGVCMIPALGAAVWPAATAWLALSLLAWLALTLLLAARLPRVDHLLLESSSPGTARLGQPLHVSLEIGNLHVDPMGLDAVLSHRAALDTQGARFRIRLQPGEQRALDLCCVPMQRGELELGQLRVSLCGRLRWLERVVTLPLQTSLRVHPAPMDPRTLHALYPDALPDRLQPTPERVLFAGLRPFVPGDDARDLSWSATARAGSPMVRSWEGPREGPVLLVIDRGAGMSVSLDELNTRLDRAITVASGLQRRLERAGRSVSLAAWSTGLDLFESDPASVARSLGALQPADQPWNPRRLAEALLPRLAPHCTVVLLTEPDGEPEALAHSLAALSRHAALRVLLVGEPALQRAVEAPVRGVEDAWARGAALLLQGERQRAVARWRASGAVVIDAGARRGRGAKDQPARTRQPVAR
jgi:uncharacterized protein (DUF58 family)